MGSSSSSSSSVKVKKAKVAHTRLPSCHSDSQAAGDVTSTYCIAIIVTMNSPHIWHFSRGWPRVLQASSSRP